MELFISNNFNTNDKLLQHLSVYALLKNSCLREAVESSTVHISVDGASREMAAMFYHSSFTLGRVCSPVL